MTEKRRAAAADTVDLALADGRSVRAPAAFVDQVVGVDADNDLLIPLDGTDHLVPLTPCCSTSGKSSFECSGVICRGCYEEIDNKYGGLGTLAVPRA
uniref:hypothetical protein n=1 Tax=Amycolatopsis sp. CA-096443 TaxID=3239919 RepID=UPI003F494D92